MYIEVGPREERLIFEALVKFFNTKNTRIKTSLVSIRGTDSLAIQSSDGATVKENFDYFCKILGLRQENIKFLNLGIGHSVIFFLAHNSVRVYAVQNLGKESVVREFEKEVKYIYQMTSKIKEYLYESTIECPSIKSFLDSLKVPFKILTQDEFFAEILFKSIYISIASVSGSPKPTKLLLQYSSI